MSTSSSCNLCSAVAFCDFSVNSVTEQSLLIFHATPWLVIVSLELKTLLVQIRLRQTLIWVGCLYCLFIITLSLTCLSLSCLIYSWIHSESNKLQSVCFSLPPSHSWKNWIAYSVCG